MSWVPNATLRIALMTDLRDAIDAGTGDGFLRLFDGTRPPAGGAATVQLAGLRFATPCGTVQTEHPIRINFANMANDPSAAASGLATWFRILDGDQNFVADGDVGVQGSGAALELADPNVVAGQPFTMGEWGLDDAFIVLANVETLDTRKRTALTSARTAALGYLNQASGARGGRPEDRDLIRRIRQAIEHGLDEKL